jgi:hypothetical protein
VSFTYGPKKIKKQIGWSDRTGEFSGFLFGLASVISATSMGFPTSIHIEDGDIIRVEGVANFVVAPNPQKWQADFPIIKVVSRRNC